MSQGATNNGWPDSVLFSNDLERAVLGAILTDGSSAFLRAAVDLREESFYRAPHRLTWKALRALHLRGVPIDIVTVTQELRKVGKLDEAGGPAWLCDLAAETPTAANLEFYAREVADFALRRDYLRLASEVTDKLRDSATKAEDVSALISARVTEALSRKSAGKTLNAGTLATEALDQINALVTSERPYLGLGTGFPALDKKLRGMKPGQLIILAARPSMGKTALALDIALHVAKREGVGVGIISLEMSGSELMLRLLASESTVHGWRIQEGRLDTAHLQRLARAAGSLSELPLVVQDEAGLGIIDVMARAQAMKLREEIGFLVVDYLQLFSPKTKEEAGNTTAFTTAASKAMKTLARQLEIPILCLSQLSRANEARGGDRKPILSDLRDSGAIEQDADVVMFIHRAEYYKGLTKATKDTINGEEYNIDGLAEVIIAKQRNGPTGSVALHFEREFPKFSSYEHSGRAAEAADYATRDEKPF